MKNRAVVETTFNIAKEVLDRARCLLLVQLDDDITEAGFQFDRKVTEGMDVVDKIRAVPTGAGSLMGYPARDVPATDVVIKTATVVSK